MIFIRFQALLGAFLMTMLGMRLITQQAGADMLGVTDRTIRNMISRGVITGYKIPGVRAVRVDRDEITSKLKAIPTGVARQEFVYGQPKFNGNVKTAPVGASVVAEVFEDDQ
ncbi:AlpA family transcriptional regulator [Nocardioides sp. LS1]|uniref:helix-turn-helix transcriptional regulator n=1 Tax=Nocardioides sp. LS1 TaxID=1027620 RepID=UPI000FF9E4F1|nr:helix-turn-helix domain-containing protein [Nocardioides sp. LS1]GCD88762.1 hypothetical protein NLS1_07680 [Nocardioides sp. LS1]